jgi:hypothetical protein
MKTTAIKRRYATNYYTSVHDRGPSFTSHGAAASEQGAIRATVVRIFMGQYGKAVVVDRETGIPIYTIKLTVEGLRVQYGRGEAEQPVLLRRVR